MMTATAALVYLGFGVVLFGLIWYFNRVAMGLDP